MTISVIFTCLLRDPLTQLFLSGKSFSGRNFFFKLSLTLFLVVALFILIYAIGKFLSRITSKQMTLPIWFEKLNQISVIVIALGVVLFAIFLAIRYSQQPILEAHGFRQTQTAITSFWMIRDGWNLSYETPVTGYPWSIPFEFPVFQTIVALIAGLAKLPLDPVGRLVSFVFLLACIWPALGLQGG